METIDDIIQNMQGDLQNYEDEVPFSLFAEYAERLRRANRRDWLIIRQDCLEPTVAIVSNVTNADDPGDTIEASIYEDDGDLELAVYGKSIFLDRDRAFALREILDAYIAGRFEQHIKEIV